MRHAESDLKADSFSRTSACRKRNFAVFVAALLSTQAAVNNVFAAEMDKSEALRVEADLLGFLNDAEQGLEHVRSSMRDRVQEIIAFVRANHAIVNRHDQSGDAVEVGDEHGFSFEFSTGLHGVSARTQGRKRLITLPEKPPSCHDDIVFCSLVAHEVNHMKWDDELRRLIRNRVISWEDYSIFYLTEWNPVVVSEEAGSRAVQFEVLNAVTKGKFRGQVKRGLPPGAPTRTVNVYYFAREYFRSPETFEAFVRKTHARVPEVRFFNKHLKPEK